MGSLKALLPWEGKTLLQHQVSQLQQSSINQLIVILGYQSSKLLPYLGQCSAEWVWNEHHEEGKTSSIKKGILSLKEDSDCFIIASVDQPVSQTLINTMIDEFFQRRSKIIIPVYKGKRGHPILFSIEMIDELLQINEESQGLKAILHKRKDEISELEVAERSVLFNFNSPQDYEAGILEGRSKRNESF